MLDMKFGPHTVNSFVSAHNAQMQRFNSRYWNPGSEAVGAFTVDWNGDNDWLCSPIGLVPRVLRHVQACEAIGTLVVLAWKSTPFWPIICPSGSSFDSFVVDCCDLPLIEMLFIPGRSGIALFSGDVHVPNTRVLALRICFH